MSESAAPAGTVQVPLGGKHGQGLYAVVDASDAGLVLPYRWRAQRSRNVVYAVRWGPGRRLILMHRAVMGLTSDDSRKIDHKNREGLDNRRANLRYCTNSQNSHNTKLRKDSRTRFKGVSWKARDGRFEARIAFDGKRISLGRFESAEIAAFAYDAHAITQCGEFALTNSDMGLLSAKDFVDDPDEDADESDQTDRPIVVTLHECKTCNSRVIEAPDGSVRCSYCSAVVDGTLWRCERGLIPLR